MLSASPSLVFHTELTISELTNKQAFYPHNNRTRAATVGVFYEDLKI